MRKGIVELSKDGSGTSVVLCDLCGVLEESGAGWGMCAGDGVGSVRCMRGRGLRWTLRIIFRGIVFEAIVVIWSQNSGQVLLLSCLPRSSNSKLSLKVWSSVGTVK